MIKIKLLKECYEFLIKCAKVEDIKTLSLCCDMLLNSDLLEDHRKESQCILKWVREQMEKIVKGDLSTKEIRSILEKDGYAIFSLLVHEVLPALVEALYQFFQILSSLRKNGHIK